MKLFDLLVREIRFRKLNFALSVTSVVVGSGCVVAALLVLRAFDKETEQTLATMAETSRKAWAQFQDEMRKDMLDMGFNLMILHKEQNISDPPDQAKYLPESYIQRLADSRIATINHVLPFLQQKVWWPERKRWVALVGTTGEIYVKNASRQQPMLERVASGNAIVGYAIHQSLDLKVGDQLAVLGKEFKIQECLSAKSFEEDEQIWIPLKDAQKLLDKKDAITGLLAINCLCSPKDLLRIHEEIASLLPDTRVVEYSSRLLTRANVRSKAALQAEEAFAREKTGRQQLREKRVAFAAVVPPLVVAVSVVWLALLMWNNTQQRRVELAILRAMGLASRKVLALFIGKAVVVGVIGALVGLPLGVVCAACFAGDVAALVGTRDLVPFALYVTAAVFMSVVGSWIPASLAAGTDPARILTEES